MIASDVLLYRPYVVVFVAYDLVVVLWLMTCVVVE